MNPQRNQQALYLSKEPSAWSLCLKIHLPVTTLARGGRGTKSHVWFLRSAECSSSIATRQLGLARVLRKVFGIDDRGAAANSAGYRKSSFARVTMRCSLTMEATGMAPLGKGGGPVVVAQP